MSSAELNDHDFTPNNAIEDCSVSDVPETHILLNKLDKPASKFVSGRSISISSDNDCDFAGEEPSSFNYITEDVFSNIFDKLSTRFYNTIPRKYYSNYEIESDDDITVPSRRFDEIRLPSIALRPRSMFRPFRSMLSPLESHTLFPEFDELATVRDGFFQSHSQDFSDNPDSYTVKTEFPGYNKGDISVIVNGDYLEISAAREAGTASSNSKSQSASSFYSSFVIPRNVDSNSISARFNNGILTVKMPKYEEWINGD